MAKKLTPEKGLRTVSIDFAGKPRTLKFAHTIIGDFEAEANSILRAIQAIEPGTMLFADRIIEQWIGNAKILSCALKHGIVPDDDPIAIDAAIDSFIEAGGAKQDLIRAVQTAYYYATNPSFAVSLNKRWQISDDRMKFQTVEENRFWDGMEKAIAEAKAKQTPGLSSTDSES